MARTNNPANDPWYAAQAKAFHDAVKNRDFDAVERIMTETLREGEFAGDGKTADTIQAMNEAYRRIKR